MGDERPSKRARLIAETLVDLPDFCILRICGHLLSQSLDGVADVLALLSTCKSLHYVRYNGYWNQRKHEVADYSPAALYMARLKCYCDVCGLVVGQEKVPIEKAHYFECCDNYRDCKWIRNQLYSREEWRVKMRLFGVRKLFGGRICARCAGVEGKSVKNASECVTRLPILPDLPHFDLLFYLPGPARFNWIAKARYLQERARREPIVDRLLASLPDDIHPFLQKYVALDITGDRYGVREKFLDGFVDIDAVKDELAKYHTRESRLMELKRVLDEEGLVLGENVECSGFCKDYVFYGNEQCLRDSPISDSYDYPAVTDGYSLAQVVDKVSNIDWLLNATPYLDIVSRTLKISEMYRQVGGGHFKPFDSDELANVRLIAALHASVPYDEYCEMRKNKRIGVK